MSDKCTSCASPLVVQNGLCASCAFGHVTQSSLPVVRQVSPKPYKIGVGLKIGWWQASLPLVELSLQHSTLTLFIQLPWRKFIFHPKDVEAIKPGIDSIYQEMLVIHKNPDYPSSLSFWVKYSDLFSLHAALTEAGFAADFRSKLD